MKKSWLVITLLLCALMVFSVSAAELSGEITYWAMWTEAEPQADVTREAIAAFQRANPGVKVNVQWSGRDIRQIIKPALDAGQNIDIFEQDAEWLVNNLGPDYFLPLDAYYDQVYAVTEGQTFEETIIPAILGVFDDYVDGAGQYLVPNQPWLVAVFYDKAAFEQAGIDFIPTTWDEFLDACAKLKAIGIPALTVDDAYVDLLIGQYLAQLKGQDWVIELVTDSTGQMWRDPAVLQFAKAFEELAAKGYISPRAASNIFPAGQMEVALGQAAMYLNGSWFPNEVANVTGPDYDWGVMAFPNVPNAVYDNTIMMFGAQAYAINKNSTNPDAAFEFLTYIVSKDIQGRFSDEVLSMPATLDTRWPDILADAQAIFEAATQNILWGGGVWDAGDLTPIIFAEFTKLIGGSVTAEQFIDNLVAAYN